MGIRRQVGEDVAGGQVVGELLRRAGAARRDDAIEGITGAAADRAPGDGVRPGRAVVTGEVHRDAVLPRVVRGGVRHGAAGMELAPQLVEGEPYLLLRLEAPVGVGLR